MDKVTMDILKKDYPELVSEILRESKDKVSLGTMKETIKGYEEGKTTFENLVEKKDEEIIKLTEKVDELKETNKTLESENKDMKVKLDVISVSEKLAEKKVIVTNLISEAKLPDESVTDIFKETLMGVQEKKDGEDTITVEEQMKKLIEDRKSISAAKTVVKGSGAEFIEAKENKKEDKLARKEIEEGVEDFLFEIDGGI